MNNFRKPRLDPQLDTGEATNLLDNSIAKHKLAIKPKKNHSSSHQRGASPQPTQQQKSQPKQIVK